MRLLDYLRLGSKGVKAHKKRAVAVVVIVGLLFGVIIAGAFVLQGLENAVLAEMLTPTEGKVLVISSVETWVCGDDCDVEARIEEIKKNIGNYGGELIPAEVVQNVGDVFYKLEGVFMDASSDVDDDAIQVIAPLATVVKLAGIKMPEHDANVAVKIRAINEARKQTLHQVIESETGEKYYIAEILPGWMYTNSLALANTKQVGSRTDSNPLDLILTQLLTGTRQNFVVSDIDAVETELIFARFDNIEAAYNYYRDKTNYCEEIDHIFATCSRDYKYRVIPAVADPLTTYKVFQDTWFVFKIIAAVLAVIALLIALSTYARLIGRDVKLVALYHAMGATSWQIRLVYVTYLAMLSAMAVVFALVVGLILATVFSMINMTGLSQAFALGFGVIKGSVWMIGWSNLILAIALVMMLAAVASVILGNGNFRAKRLARKLK